MTIPSINPHIRPSRLERLWDDGRLPTDSLIVDCKDSPEAVERSSGYRALSAFFRRVDNARARFAKNYHPSAHNLSMVERAKKSGADGSRDAAGKLLLSPSHPSDTCRIYTPNAGTHPPLFILKSLAGNYLINPSLRDGEFGRSVFQRFWRLRVGPPQHRRQNEIRRLVTPKPQRNRSHRSSAPHHPVRAAACGRVSRSGLRAALCGGVRR